MAESKPGADELRVRGMLRQRGVGADAIPPKPAVRPRDWLDDILDTKPDPAPKAALEPAPDAPPTVETTEPKPPVAWLAAVPAASTVVGVLLYGTPSL